jgi:branched-chain amino acid transport system ATP-binding protein
VTDAARGPQHGAAAPLLDVDRLGVFYENALALNDVSLRVNAGEIAGVFGSNGAGKTTLLNTIAGLTLHRAIKEARKGGERVTVLGEVRLAGEPILQLRPSARVARGLVLCRERHPVFRESTVEENLEIGGYLRPPREAAESLARVYQIFTPLTRLRRRKAGLLSGGEQRMLSIGMALVARPRLLLLDEPLLGLSPMLQGVVVDAMQEIQRQGITILVTEQYARPILPIVDRGYVLENGALNLSGTGAELLDDPDVKAAYFGV